MPHIDVCLYSLDHWFATSGPQEPKDLNLMTGDSEVSVWLSQLIFIIPTCIVAPATKNDIKVVLDQEKIGNPCLRLTTPL